MPIDPLPLSPPEAHVDPSVPAGAVECSRVPVESPELNHRPHPFALSYGEDGARVTFGQLLYRFDTLRIYQQIQYPNRVIGPAKHLPDPGTISVIKVGQDKIMGVKSIIPKIGSAEGEEMDPESPFLYHQLDDYGDVYLNWKVKLDAVQGDDGDKTITECYVSLSDLTTEEGSTGVIAGTQMEGPDYQRAPLFQWATNRFNDSYAQIAAGGGLGAVDRLDQEGEYSVKIGTVHEDQRIEQHLSSDVYFPFIVLIKHLEETTDLGGIEELETTTGGLSMNDDIAAPAPES